MASKNYSEEAEALRTHAAQLRAASNEVRRRFPDSLVEGFRARVIAEAARAFDNEATRVEAEARAAEGFRIFCGRCAKPFPLRIKEPPSATPRYCRDCIGQLPETRGRALTVEYASDVIGATYADAWLVDEEGNWKRGEGSAEAAAGILAFYEEGSQ